MGAILKFLEFVIAVGALLVILVLVYAKDSEGLVGDVQRWLRIRRRGLPRKAQAKAEALSRLTGRTVNQVVEDALDFYERAAQNAQRGGQTIEIGPDSREPEELAVVGISGPGSTARRPTR